MSHPPTPLPDARAILRLARKDRAATSRSLENLSLADQVALVCAAPVSQRAALLELTPQPERIVPLMPKAELCFTVKSVGLDDASWLLEHATSDQIVACADLDGWTGFTPDLVALDTWFSILAEAGLDTVARAAQSLDAELTVLYLQDRLDVWLKPNGDDSWEPPDASQTLEGQFYFRTRSEKDDGAAIIRMLHALFERDYWLYFRLMQGVIWEVRSELEEWAQRWRTGRLEELGFPSWDSSMRIYGYLRPERRADIADRALEGDGRSLPVWMSQLPAGADAAHPIFKAAADLTPEERGQFFYAFLTLANMVAVADRLSLGDPETMPHGIEKAARVASEGLEFVAHENGLSWGEALRRTSVERLFRVGASIHPEHLPLSVPDAE